MLQHQHRPHRIHRHLRQRLGGARNHPAPFPAPPVSRSARPWPRKSGRTDLPAPPSTAATDASSVTSSPSARRDTEPRHPRRPGPATGRRPPAPITAFPAADSPAPRSQVTHFKYPAAPSRGWPLSPNIHPPPAPRKGRAGLHIARAPGYRMRRMSTQTHHFPPARGHWTARPCCCSAASERAFRRDRSGVDQRRDRQGHQQKDP